MREILFRGKRKDTGEWVYGYLGVFKGISQIYVPFTEEEEKENEGHIFSAIGGLWHTVSPETVGQYTGVTDKNGKRFFEGDICKQRSEYSGEYIISVVTYEDGEFLAMVGNNSAFCLSDRLDVIGNIHDNPELLKGE